MHIIVITGDNWFTFLTLLYFFIPSTNRSEWNKVLRSRDRSALVAQQKLISVSLNDEDIFKECQSPSLECNKKPENVFNFDAPFIHDKKPFAYKNISDHSISEQPPLAPEMKITENRLYPLLNGSLNNNVGHCVEAELGDLKDNTKICTNSCKCNVEILQLDDGTDVETWAKGSPCSIKVSGCECDSLGNESGANQKKAMCNLVDNQCYYKEDLCSEKRNQNEECIITSKQLLEFAKQIAIGMVRNFAHFRLIREKNTHFNLMWFAGISGSQ